MPDNVTPGEIESSPLSTPDVTGESSSPVEQTPQSEPAKFEIGMGPRDNTQTPQETPSTELSMDQVFEKYGDKIFEHDRFKELTQYQSKYKQAEPLINLAEKAGGIDSLQNLTNAFGSVYSKMMQAENPNQLWENLIPYLQVILRGENLPDYNKVVEMMKGSQPESQEEYADDESNQDLNQFLDPVNQKIDSLQKRLDQEEKQKTVERQNANYEKYEAMLDELIGTDPLMKDLKLSVIGPLVVNNLPVFMPKGPDGRPINPLDKFSPDALKQVFEKVVRAEVKKIKGSILSQHKTSVENGGQPLPDTTNGATPRGPTTPQTDDDKANHMAQRLKQLGFGN